MTSEEAIVALVIGVGGWVLGALTSQFNYEQKAEEIFFNALNWLGGGSQNRSIGISAIELYLSADSSISRLRRNRFRDLSVYTLTGSAIYLISRSEQKNSAIELHNLDRIMDLLINEKSQIKYQLHYNNVRSAIDAAIDLINKSGSIQRPRGLWVERDKLVEWKGKL